MMMKFEVVTGTNCVACAIIWVLMLRTAMAQTVIGNWTWLTGSTGINQAGNYGSRGLPSVSNVPGARERHTMVMDNVNHIVYVFGGAGGLGSLNDLWMFNATSRLWTWLAGSTGINQVGTYGTSGVAAADNVPGARYQYSMTMDDTNQAIYMLGGRGYGASGFGALNDFWMFNTTSRMWIWLTGSNGINQFGVYGTRGLAAVYNVPGSRGCHSMVMDNVNQIIYAFGGTGYGASGGTGFLNDLWMFNATSRVWIWLAGSNSVDPIGVYGTRGTATVDNVPSGRYFHSMAIDIANQNIYVLGGVGKVGAGENTWNDMWMFSTTSGIWTWLAGSNVAGQVGIYGIRGMAGVEYTPGARQGHAMVMDNVNEVIYVFGGIGLGASGPGYLNDLWMFNTTNRLWTWLTGSNVGNQAGTYGVRGVTALSNIPGSRGYPSMTMHSESQVIYVLGGNGFGASGFGYMNDFWTFAASSNAGARNQNPLKCEIGFGLNKLGNGCVPCGSDSYKSTVSHGFCIPCPTGATCNGSSFICNVGFGLNQTENGCVQCGSTTFKLIASNDDCLPCPDNAVCDVLGSSFTCISGYFANFLSHLCLPITSYMPSASSIATYVSPTTSPVSPSVRSKSNWWILLWITNPAAGILIMVSLLFSLFLIGFLSGWITLRWSSANITESMMTTASTATSWSHTAISVANSNISQLTIRSTNVQNRSSILADHRMYHVHVTLGDHSDSTSMLGPCLNVTPRNQAI